VYAGWCNAAKGMECVGYGERLVRQPVEGHAEINESLYPPYSVEPGLPHRFGGAGQWRGDAAATTSKRYGSSRLYTYVVG